MNHMTEERQRYLMDVGRLIDFLDARITEDERNAERMLAECEAKRRIVGELLERQAMVDAEIANPAFSEDLRDEAYDEGYEYGLEVALRFLALPYADHPDYGEDWRP
jgi:hypothetical protein